MSCPCTNSWDAFRRLSRFALELSMSGFAPECSILMYGCRCLSHLFLLQQQEVIPVGTRERIQYQTPPLSWIVAFESITFLGSNYLDPKRSANFGSTSPHGSLNPPFIGRVSPSIQCVKTHALDSCAVRGDILQAAQCRL